jgi:hypothetical protein
MLVTYPDIDCHCNGFHAEMSMTKMMKSLTLSITLLSASHFPTQAFSALQDRRSISGEGVAEG